MPTEKRQPCLQKIVLIPSLTKAGGFEQHVNAIVMCQISAIYERAYFARIKS